LRGFAVIGVEPVAGEVWLHVETVPKAVGCPDGGVVASAHGGRASRLRDLPVADRAAVVMWHKRVWRCHEPLCERAMWTERRDEAARLRFSLTDPARPEICRQVARGRSVADLAVAFGCGWQTTMSAVWAHGQPVVDDPACTAGVRTLAGGG
jgi:hypothetical protein